MTVQPKGISYTPVFEPDMDSMVRALKLMLRWGKKRSFARGGEISKGLSGMDSVHFDFSAGNVPSVREGVMRRA